MSEIIASINVIGDADITVKSRFKYKIPPFDMVVHTRRKSMNALDMYSHFREMTANEHKLFWSLMQNRDPVTNLSTYVPQNQVEIAIVKRGYKLLKERQILKRVKRGVYLINPNSYIPTPETYQTVINHWNSIP